MLLTCEQVSAGHPDKICDQISDAIVTDCLYHDKNSRVAVECMIKNDEIFIAGEITSQHEPDFRSLALNILKRIGLENVDRYRTHVSISRQSPDIAMGVDVGGAGDQGTVYGYATNETPEMLPVPFVLATNTLELLRAANIDGLLPDAKCQVSYDTRKKRITTFLLSTQHREDIPIEEVRLIGKLVMETAAQGMNLNNDYKALVNPTGRFVTGGSFADTGVTGRKIIADSYGCVCHHGGGAFSGKDPTKVDRSGAYMARKVARDVVKNGFASRCEIALSYAIGLNKPVAIGVDCFGTNKVPIQELISMIRLNYNLSPRGIISELGLREVDYNTVSAYGHFGKGWLPWEQ